jgi:purine nucleosidase
MAHNWPGATVDAVTVCYGNMPLEVASANARYSIELCGAQTPVYEGCARPLLRDVAHAEWFHGPEGMGMLGRLHPKQPPAGTDAIQQLIRRFGEAPGEITLVTLGR